MLKHGRVNLPAVKIVFSLPRPSIWRRPSLFTETRAKGSAVKVSEALEPFLGPEWLTSMTFYGNVWVPFPLTGVLGQEVRAFSL